MKILIIALFLFGFISGYSQTKSNCPERQKVLIIHTDTLKLFKNRVITLNDLLEYKAHCESQTIKIWVKTKWAICKCDSMQVTTYIKEPTFNDFIEWLK